MENVNSKRNGKKTDRQTDKQSDTQTGKRVNLPNSEKWNEWDEQTDKLKDAARLIGTYMQFLFVYQSGPE